MEAVAHVPGKAISGKRIAAGFDDRVDRDAARTVPHRLVVDDGEMTRDDTEKIAHHLEACSPCLKQSDLDQFPPGAPGNACKVCMYWWADGIKSVLKEDIVGPLEDAWARMRQRAGGLPRTVNMITGPSRSARSLGSLIGHSQITFAARRTAICASA